MSDEQRLTEIEEHIDTEPVDLSRVSWPELCNLCRAIDKDRMWLMEHVRALAAENAALRAQAALGAKVVEAARDYQAARDAYIKVDVTDIAGWPKACVEVGYKYERLCRALAAREVTHERQRQADRD